MKEGRRDAGTRPNPLLPAVNMVGEGREHGSNGSVVKRTSSLPENQSSICSTHVRGSQPPRTRAPVARMPLTSACIHPHINTFYLKMTERAISQTGVQPLEAQSNPEEERKWKPQSYTHRSPVLPTNVGKQGKRFCLEPQKRKQP